MNSPPGGRDQEQVLPSSDSSAASIASRFALSPRFAISQCSHRRPSRYSAVIAAARVFGPASCRRSMIRSNSSGDDAVRYPSRTPGAKIFDSEHRYTCRGPSVEGVERGDLLAVVVDVAVAVVLHDDAAVFPGDAQQLHAALARHDVAGGVLVAGEHVDETRGAALAAQAFQRARERIGAHAPAVDRYPDHLDAETAIRANGAGVAVLLHDHDVVASLAQRFRRQGDRLHRAVGEGDSIGVEPHAFAIEFALRHQPAQALVAEAAGIGVELDSVAAHGARCGLRQVIGGEGLGVGGAGAEVEGVHVHPFLSRRDGARVCCRERRMEETAERPAVASVVGIDHSERYAAVGCCRERETEGSARASCSGLSRGNRPFKANRREWMLP